MHAVAGDVLSPSDAQPGQKMAHGELILDADEATRKLNAQHHSYKVLETRRVPGPIGRPAMKDVKDFALSKSDLDVIHRQVERRETEWLAKRRR